jgi:hypothetical protein
MFKRVRPVPVSSLLLAATAMALASAVSAGAALPSASREDGLKEAWSAQTQKPIAHEVNFTSGEALLSGTLWLPAGVKRSPVVVVYHSASDSLRSAPLYRHLVEMLPPMGIGVFVFDRRGSGQSTGPSANGSFDLLAADGVAARRALEKLSAVDARRIGYWGLSQGGWLAALAANMDRHSAFAISISAPMVTADAQMRFAVANILRIRGYDQVAIDQAVDARLGVDQFMRGETTRADAQRRLDAAIAQPWFELIYMGKTFGDPDRSGWAQEMRNDPLAVVKSVRTPMLILYGAADPWVPVQTSLDRLQSTVRDSSNITTHVVRDADHALMRSASLMAQVDPKATAKQAPDAPEYFAVLSKWLTQIGLTSDQPR